MQCMDAETYGYCHGQGGGQYNLDPLLNVNAYADGIDSNPYVVGSQAYNQAHGLPPGPAFYERQDIRAALAAGATPAAAAQAAGMVIVPGAPLRPGVQGAVFGAAAPSLEMFALIALAALLLLKR